MFLLVFPLLGVVIGWGTNYLAIKFLFRPRKPVKLGPINIQGVIPRRRKQLAQAVGDVVATELLTGMQIANALNSPGIRKGLAATAGRAAASRLTEKSAFLPVPSSLRTRIIDFVSVTVENEVRDILSQQGSDITLEMLSNVDLASLVQERLEEMEWDYMENIVYSVAGRELRLIEVMGGVLGGLVGLIQALLVLYL